MSRRAGVIGVLVVAASLAASLIARAHQRAEVERRYVAFVQCTIGEERVPVAEAEVRARRLHPDASREELEPCVVAADAVHRTWGARWFHPALVRSADGAVRAFERVGMPDVAELLELSRGLPWTRTRARTAVPTFVLDRDIPRLRAASNDVAVLWPQDRTITDALVFSTSQRRLVLHESARGVWSAMRWEPRRSVRTRATSSITPAQRAADIARAALIAPTDQTILVDGTRLCRRGRELSAFLDDAPLEAPGGFETIPDGSTLDHVQICDLGATRVLAVGGPGDVAVLELRGATLSSWGIVRRTEPRLPEVAGAWKLSCDHGVARVAFATSHPVGAGPSALASDEPWSPHASRHHGVVSAQCTASGCTQREVSVRGIDTRWVEDRFRAMTAWTAPEAIAFGDRILLVWHARGPVVRYRAAPLEELDVTPNAGLVESYWPEENGTIDDRRVAYAEVDLHARHDVALVSIRESGPPAAATYFVRFAGASPPELMTPPAP